MSRDVTWVVDPCTKFELDTTYRSRVRTDDYTFPFTASLYSQFYVFEDKDGQISNFIFLTAKRHYLGQDYL